MREAFESNEILNLNTEERAFDLSDASMISQFNAEVAQNNYHDDLKKLVLQTTMGLKKISNASYKSIPNVEMAEIEHIKNALKNFTSRTSKVNEFKDEIINDLTNFQKKIEINHAQKIKKINTEKHNCEVRIKVIERERKQHMFYRALCFAWPYDEKTKQYDNAIATLETRIENCREMLLEAYMEKPHATEKDLILYQIHLKGKCAA